MQDLLGKHHNSSLMNLVEKIAEFHLERRLTEHPCEPFDGPMAVEEERLHDILAFIPNPQHKLPKNRLKNGFPSPENAPPLGIPA